MSPLIESELSQGQRTFLIQLLFIFLLLRVLSHLLIIKQLLKTYLSARHHARHRECRNKTDMFYDLTKL